MELTAAIDLYRAQGFAPLGRVLDDATLAALRARADALMLGQVVHEGLFFQHDSDTGRYDELRGGRGYEGPSLRYRKLEKLERDDVFRGAMERPLFAEAARRVLGDPVSLYRAVLFNKAANGGTELPWHQDAGKFWGLSKDPELQIWVALDDAPVESGCLEILPRSHLGGRATPLGGVIPEPLTRGKEGVKVAARAGDALLIHNHVWHRSGVNRTPNPRRALTMCLLDAETRCVRMKKKPREFVRMFAAL